MQMQLCSHRRLKRAQRGKLTGFNLLGKNVANDQHNTAPKWMDNRITDDGEYHYEYDCWVNTTKKYKVEGNEQHHYQYDSNHRLIRYELESDAAVRGANYHYDPFGRRVVKQVQEGDAEGQLQGELQTTFFGWDGDRLVLTEKDKRQVHTIYEPGSFAPMIRVEGRKLFQKCTLAQKLQLEQEVHMNQAMASLIDGLKDELRCERLSARSTEWMQAAQMSPNVLKDMLDEGRTLENKQVHLYQCDHLGTPLKIAGWNGENEWAGIFDVWGKYQESNEIKKLHQPIRLPGQYADSESDLYYNRHRFYFANGGRYVNQDPIGLSGGFNFFGYVSNPLMSIDPLGLAGQRGRRSPSSVVSVRDDVKKMNQHELDIFTSDILGRHSNGVDRLGDRVNPNKKIWEQLSPYDYMQYCAKWRPDNGMTCGREPDHDNRNYMPYKKHWRTSEIPSGYSCLEPYYFPDFIDSVDSYQAGPDDILEMLGNIARNRKYRARK